MAIEHARTRVVAKPWGVTDLHPYGNAVSDHKIGEIWYEREGGSAAESSLLLKLIFTSEPLSIQVHPDDAYAQSIGQPNGKSEAWYVLRATPDAKIALGLTESLTAKPLRDAIDDGSISSLVAWQAASAGDVFSVPAGTIHAIGAGLVIAEIQQRSDATFRIFDFGRERELHVDHAVAVVSASSPNFKFEKVRLSPDRVQVVSSPHFVLEHIELTPNSTWRLETDRETWLLAVSGDARAGTFNIAAGGAVFVQSDSVKIHVGPRGLIALAAYTGTIPIPNLLGHLGQDGDRARDQRSSVDLTLKRQAELGTARQKSSTVLL